MDVDSMEAGPELDALIAERVMGKQWYVNQRGRYFLIDPDSALLDVVQPCPRPPPAKFSEAARMNDGHPYSSDIAEAWRVVERLRMTGGLFNIHIGTNSVEVLVSWKNGAGQQYADTFPLAVCKAVLDTLNEDA